MHYAIRSVDETISAAIRKGGAEATHSSLLGALISEGIVMDWVLAQPRDVEELIVKSRKATERNVILLDELWKLFARHGIHLSGADKVALLESFLGDN